MIHNTSPQWTLDFGTVLNSERHYGTTLAKHGDFVLWQGFNLFKWNKIIPAIESYGKYCIH